MTSEGGNADQVASICHHSRSWLTSHGTLSEGAHVAVKGEHLPRMVAKSLSAPRGLPCRSESGKSASIPCSNWTALSSANRMTTTTRKCLAEGQLPTRSANVYTQE